MLLANAKELAHPSLENLIQNKFERASVEIPFIEGTKLKPIGRCREYITAFCRWYDTELLQQHDELANYHHQLNQQLFEQLLGCDRLLVQINLIF